MARYTCPKCGGNYPGFHICMEMDAKTAQEVVLSPEQKAANRKGRYKAGKQHTEESRRLMSEAAKARHAAADNSKRDAKIIELYKAGQHTQIEISQELKVGNGTVSRVLRAAAERGEVTIRPRGKSVRRSEARAVELQGIRERRRNENRERDALIIKRYTEEPISQRALAESMGLTIHVVRYVLAEAADRGEVVVRQQGANEARHAAHNAKMKEIKEDLLRDYKETSISLEDLARKYKVNRTTLADFLKSCGVVITNKKRPLKETNPQLYADILKLYQDRTLKLTEISERLGTDVSTISRVTRYAIEHGELSGKRRKPDIEKEVFKVYEETTESFRAIADRFGVSHSHIMKIVLAGIENGDCKPRTKPTD